MAAGVMAIQMGEHGRVSKGVFSKSGIFRLKKCSNLISWNPSGEKKKEKETTPS